MIHDLSKDVDKLEGHKLRMKEKSSDGIKSALGK